MKAWIPFSMLTLWLLAALCSCRTKDNSAEEPLVFNPYVEAFTSGNISRYTPLCILFAREVPAELQTPEEARKRIQIKPKIDGTFTFEDAHTLVFTPKNGFARNTTYRVKADLEAWFSPERKEDRHFAFRFTTLPFSVRAEFNALGINEHSENAFDLSCILYTLDHEEPATIEQTATFSEKTPVIWTHSEDGRRHEALLQHVEASAQGSRPLSVGIGPNKLGAKEETLLTLNIPGRDEFSVYHVRYVKEPERYIEVTFTQPLDGTQDLRGLAYITYGEDQYCDISNIDGNRLLLYPDAKATGALDLHLSQELRSARGVTLGQNVIRKVETGGQLPEVRFTGKGVIVPQSEQLMIPFQAVYVRGVVVRVIRILERNIGQFLQTNDLGGDGELMRVGRLLARKTIFLDDDPTRDLTQLDTYALDLRQLIQPEPGAIYRVELSINKQLSAYPCEGYTRLSKEEILAQDELKFREEVGRFDAGGYYFYYNDQYDGVEYSYDWQERNNPCSDSYYEYQGDARNVLTTNLGLMALRGEGGQMTVLVHNLLNTEPEKEVTVRLYGFQNQQLGQGVTDAQGRVTIDAGSGRPYYIAASQGMQRAYLRVDNGSALSVSSFDVSGQVVQKGIKGFIYGDRGVWRPGDTLHLGFMLNDRLQQLPEGHPVVMELYNPLGQLTQRKTLNQGELGLYAFDLVTPSDAPTGAWNARVNVGGVTFEKRVRIESIKPNRLKIKLSPQDQTLLKGHTTQADLHVEWLQGATARNMKYDLEVSFANATTAFADFKNYTFTDRAKTFDSEESTLISGRTDDSGNATVPIRLEAGSAAPGMLTALLTMRVYEESGEFSLDALQMPYSPYTRYAGIESPQKGLERLATGTMHTFRVASVSHDGRSQAGVPLEVEVYKVEWYWWWNADGGNLARYVSNAYNAPVKRLSITTGRDGRATFDLRFSNEEWGSYYIRVTDPASKHSAGILSYFDWPYLEGRRDADGSSAANLLVFKTDKEQYAPGENIVITFPSSEGSRAIVSIQNGSKVLSLDEYTCKEKETTVKVKATPEMQPNAYVSITLLQPSGNTLNDLPIRLYGIVPVTVSSPDSRLQPVIRMNDEIKPETRYELTVSEKEGREMAYTLAIVDEGLLDLTRFRTPDPWQAFNAREALGVSTWDLYNFVVGAYGGHIEQLFSIGGDDALAKGPKAVVNRFKPVVQFAGPFWLGRGEKRRHTYTMPNYNGRVRVMVVAGNGSAYGNAEKSVLVRKPVMLLGTLPRVIGVQEEMAVPVTVFATEPNVGAVRVSIRCSDNLEVVGQAQQTLNFTRAEDRQALFRLRTKGTPGAAHVTLTAEGKGERSTYETDMEIRSVRTPQTRVKEVMVAAGKSWQGDVAMSGATGTNKALLEVSTLEPLNLSARLAYLMEYPHGCVEQVVSRVFPQLYLSGVADLTPEQAQASEKNIKEGIARLGSFLTAEGALSYWPGQTSTNAWGTVYATHFLCEAQAKGYLVPDNLKRNLLANLRTVARTWKNTNPYLARSEELTQAYRLYALALAGVPEVGAMNRLREQESASQMTRWMLAAAYAQIGRKDVAGELASKTVSLMSAGPSEYDFTFGSELRDKAIILQTLCLLDRSTEAATVARELSKSFASERWMSTQECAYGLLALSKYLQRYAAAGNGMEFEYTFDGKNSKVATDKSIRSVTLADHTAAQTVPLTLRNDGKQSLFVRIITEGIPEQGQEVASYNGIVLRVAYTDTAGKPIDVAKLPQGTNFMAVATIENPTVQAFNNLVLTQVFPAGWEILNTRYLNDNTPKAPADTPTGVSYQDIRDDRVHSYIDRLPSGSQVSVRINLCAVYPGQFYLPPVRCEAMYDHLIQANTAGVQVVVE